MTPDQLATCTGARADVAELWRPHIEAAMARWGITSPKRQAAFLAQIGVESAHLTAEAENLNYAAEALVRMWPARFDTATAQRVGRTADHPADQEAIANIAYAGRYGNGDAASGDGFRFRGRGCLQTTFRANYQATAAGIGVDVLTNPDLLLLLENAAQAAGWYWQTHGCNELADSGDFTRLTIRINGGTNGLEQRKALWAAAREALNA